MGYNGTHRLLCAGVILGSFGHLLDKISDHVVLAGLFSSLDMVGSFLSHLRCNNLGQYVNGLSAAAKLWHRII